MKVTEENKITINDTEYDVESLNDRQKYLLQQVNNLRTRIAEARFNLDQMIAAENSFTNTLVESVKEEEAA